MIIPHDQLNPETLTALIEEFVTREGALHGHAETPLAVLIASVRRQLETGTAVIVFDEASETASIVTSDSMRHRDADEPSVEDAWHHGGAAGAAAEETRRDRAGEPTGEEAWHDGADEPTAPITADEEQCD